MIFLNSTNYFILFIVGFISVFSIISIFVSLTFFLIRRKKSKEKSIRNLKSFKSISAWISFSISIFLLFSMTIILSIAILRPGNGYSIAYGNVKNLDIIFIIDTTRSMSAIDGDESGKDRLEKSQSFISDFVKEDKNNRYALITFTHTGIMDIPLTYDSQTFITGIETLSTVESYGAKGSNINSGLKLVDDFFGDGDFTDPESKDRQKVLIIISDGEDNENLYPEANINIAKLAEKNIPTFTLGVGTKVGAKVVYYTDLNGEKRYTKFQGKDIISKLNEENLVKLSESGNGKYLNISNNNSARQDLEKMLGEKSVRTQSTNSSLYIDELYFWIILVFLTLFIIFELKLFDIPKSLYKKEKL